MGSLQELCYHAICLSPEQTLGLDFDGVNQPCLLEIVKRLSMFDLLQYETKLKERGLDTVAAILQCQTKLWGKPPDSHMPSVVYPHLLDFSSHDGQNWFLSRIFYGKVVRNFVEDLHETHLMRTLFDHDEFFLPILSAEIQKSIFCPPESCADDFTKRMQSLPDGSLMKLLVLIAQKTLSMTVDIKVCKLYSHHRLKTPLDTYLKNLQVLSVVLNSSPLLLDFVKTFREQGECLRKICVHAIKNSDLQYLDSVLSVCSGVVGYHSTDCGGPAKSALDAMLVADQRLLYGSDSDSSSHSPERQRISSSQSSDRQQDSPVLRDCPRLPLSALKFMRQVKKDFLDSSESSGSNDTSEDDKELTEATKESMFHTVSGDSGNVESSQSRSSKVKSSSSTSADLDLMDEAVLLETQSKLDSTTGIDKVDLKFTNLVSPKFYNEALKHHLSHWLALTHLHLGVPETNSCIIQGLKCVLQRRQFRSLTLSSAMVSFDDIREIITTVATCRSEQPLDNLMFVSLQSKYKNNRMPIDIDEQEPMDSDDLGDLERAFDDVPESLTRYGGFPGTKVLEVYYCTLDVFTGLLLKQFVLQSTSLRSLCLTSCFNETFMTYIASTLALTENHKPLHTLVLEDWLIEESWPLDTLVSLLKKVSSTLTSLSLRSCFLSNNRKSIDDVMVAISCCKQLKTLDLGDNLLEKDAGPFMDKVATHTEVMEISLKNNSLQPDLLKYSLTQLAMAVKHRRVRLKVLDIRGNQLARPEGDKQNQGTMIKFLHREVAERVLYDEDDISYIQL